MALTHGTHLGPYEITAQIREGGMGKVHQVTDTKFWREAVMLARERPPHRRRSPLRSAFTRGLNPHLTKWRKCRHWVESVLRPRGSWYALSPPTRASRSKY
jgi:hypothetical protein